MIWNPLPRDLEHIGIRLGLIFQSWKGTPYSECSQAKGGGVDCVRFCCGVVDELFDFSRANIESLPSDACFHSRETALGGMKKLKELYNPLVTVGENDLQPGDLIVSGPLGKNGGPGHLMIVGSLPKSIWHCTNHVGVVRTGMTVPMGHKHFVSYRFQDREKWLTTF